MDVIAKYRKLYFNEIYRNRRFHDRLEEGISLFHTRSDVIYIAFRFYRHKTVLLCRRVRITPKKNSQKWCKANGEITPGVIVITDQLRFLVKLGSPLLAITITSLHFLFGSLGLTFSPPQFAN